MFAPTRPASFSCLVLPPFVWLLALCAALLPRPGWAEELPVLPADRQAALLARLTPLDTVLAASDLPIQPEDDGCILLSERIVVVDPEGRRTTVRQVAYKSFTDSGVKTNAEDTVSFRKVEQQAYILQAQTIQPDGTRQAVRPNALLLQSPQRQAQYSLYDDAAEIRIIFPNVKPGSVVHLISVVEDRVARFPGEFSQSIDWTASWPLGLYRSEVDLPRALADRLKIETLGTGTPSPRISPAGGDRVRFAWEVSRQPGRRYERNSPPSQQVGPVVLLSTVADWDRVAHWYRGLLAGRDQLSPALAAKVDAWIAGAPDREAVIARLHSHIANDVRYVGLEFGAADFQPHACNEVWENQYGDCKDKANLLVACLGHAGIKAYVTLVNTDPPGLVDRRSPTHRVFDHAIVAIPQPAGDYLFCDPTIDYSTPGLLGSGSRDRDVLVVTESGAAWVRTPADGVARSDYRFDLKLAENGELSGWLVLESAGSYAAGDRHLFTRLDADDTRSELAKIVRGFFPGAQIIDAERTSALAPAPYSVKTYFVVPPAATGSDDLPQLAFPRSASQFNDLGDRESRENAYCAPRDTVTATAAITLPATWGPEKLPDPFRFESPAVDLLAEWTYSAGVARSQLVIDTKQTLIRPADFSPVYRAQQAALAWLATPLVLRRNATHQPVAAATELDLPIMPTGDGQIDLVDRRYPENGDPLLRQRALLRTQQYFPQDPLTLFRAGVRLALIDWNADRNQAAFDRLSGLLASYAGKIKPETVAWAENMTALVLRDLHRQPEALVLLERVARNAAISDGRRADAAADFADLVAATAPGDALPLLTSVVDLPQLTGIRAESRLLHALLLLARPEDVARRLQERQSNHPTDCEETFDQLLQVADAWKLPGDEARVTTLADIISRLCPSPAAKLGATLGRLRDTATLRALHDEVLVALTRPPFATWYEPLPAGERRTAEEFARAITAASDAGDPVRCVRVALQALATLGIEGDFGERIWTGITYSEWAERKLGQPAFGLELCDALLAFSDRLPLSDSSYYEGQFIRAKRLARAGDRAGELATFRAIASAPQLPVSFRGATAKKLGGRLEADGDYAAALAAYRPAETVIDRYGIAADCLLRATLISLDQGNDDEALRLLGLLAGAPASVIQASANPEQINDLIAVSRHPQARAYWDYTRRWWPQWPQHAEKINLAANLRAPVVPVLPLLTELGETMGKARRSSQFVSYYENYALLLSAARWQPSLASEVASLVTLSLELITQERPAARALVIQLLAGPHPAELPGLRRRLVLLAANYFDANQYAESLRALADFDRLPPAADGIAPAAHRIHALNALALGQQLPVSIAALERDLADPAADPQRGLSARLLFDLYVRSDRTTEAAQLLDRELANPVVQADAEAVKTLQARQSQLAATLGFSTQVSTWIQAAGLEWYADSEPRNLEDPRLADIEAALRQTEATFTRAEQVKLLLLAAQDARRTLEQRQISFREGVRRLLLASPDYPRMHALLASVVDQTAFDNETRLQTVWNGLTTFAEEFRPADYARWRQHAIVSLFNEDYQARVAVLDREVRVDPLVPGTAAALARELAGEPMTAFRSLVMHDLFAALVQAGDLPAAEALLKGIPQWRLAADFTAGTSATQLDYARRLRVAKSTHAVHEALREAYLRHFPLGPIAAPATLQDARFLAFPRLRLPAETHAEVHSLIRHRRLDRTSFGGWANVLRALPPTPATPAVIQDLLHVGLTAIAADDSLRAELIQTFVANCDLDHPAVAAALQAEFQPYRRLDQNPVSYRAVCYFDWMLADRSGALPDPAGALPECNDPDSTTLRRMIQVSAYLRRQDRAHLEGTLDQVDSGLLLSPYFLAHTLPAFALLGRDTELALARDVARRETQRAVQTSWIFADADSAQRALSLARHLNEPDLLPLPWIEHLAARDRAPLVDQSARLMRAFLRSAWPEAEAAAAVLNREFPTHYHYYYFRGVALEQLHREAEAIAAFATYTRFAKNEADYPDACRRLAALQAAAGKH